MDENEIESNYGAKRTTIIKYRTNEVYMWKHLPTTTNEILHPKIKNKDPDFTKTIGDHKKQ